MDFAPPNSGDITQRHATPDWSVSEEPGGTREPLALEENAITAVHYPPATLTMTTPLAAAAAAAGLRRGVGGVESRCGLLEVVQQPQTGSNRQE
ncbi:glycine receptor subunit alpha-3-like isoform X2 [Anopheles sinensis]|uniref:Glycine receptor subunit alpha-3-like isoform X2 n=1 Tax=Anopheles sinensis TaxID=74873 RepID=A0A084WDL2_ANOSI|nr:glycine receptor subunit alpha-3-like isoform X2 [Anopheles sinensis]